MSALAVLPLLNRLDALIKKIDELIVATTGVVPPGVEVVVPPPQVIVERLNNRYYIVDDIDTSDTTERSLGLKEILKKQGIEYARYLTILDVGGDFTYRLNEKSAKSLTAFIGAEHIFEVEEIWVTGSGVAGTAIIFMEYRVE